MTEGQWGAKKAGLTARGTGRAADPPPCRGTSKEAAKTGFARDCMQTGCCAFLVARRFRLRDAAFIARIGSRATKRGHPMPKQIDEKDFAAILAAVERYAGGASRADIAEALEQKLLPRTLQFRLRSLVDPKHLRDG